MSTVPQAERQLRSRKKKVIAGLTLVLLLVLVSLLDGLSRKMAPSRATSGAAVQQEAADPPGTPGQPPIPPRPRPRPRHELAKPLTPAEKIMMEVARYGNSATDDANDELPLVAGGEPPLVAGAASAPDQEASGPPDFPWPQLPHDNLPLLRSLPPAADCPCKDGPSPCPDDPPPANGGDPPPGGWIPPGTDGPPIITPPGNGGGAPPVPEPGTLFLAGTGLACLAALGRQRRGSGRKGA